MKKIIWILPLVFIAWGLVTFLAGPRLQSGMTGARYSEQEGRCRIEMVFDKPFTLIVTGPEGERRVPSSFDMILFQHKAEVVTNSAFKSGGVTGWRAQFAGAEYQVVSATDEIRTKIEPIEG